MSHPQESENYVVEQALKEWFTPVRKEERRLAGPLLKQKVEELATKMGKEAFVATNGWFFRWTKRENTKYGKLTGEVGEADAADAHSWLRDV